MQIDAPNRQATLSVGEFASFTPYATPGYGGVTALWRAQLGTQWHQRIQSESTAAGEGMRNEVSLSGPLRWRGWTLQLSGRIDQLKESGAHIQLREIKTLTEPLPLGRDALLERYPSYPIQLLAYRELLLQNPEPSAQNPVPSTQYRAKRHLRSSATKHPAPSFALELLLVEVGSGLTQSLALDSTYDVLLADQLDALVDFLEAQQERLARLRSLAVQPAYPTPRPGQETIQADLAAAFSQSRITLLEAPTGYGKTGVAWEYSARRLASGESDRVLYLTSKSTGQTEALTRLRSLLSPSSPSATFWHIRNKKEHCIHTEFRCSRQTCPYLNNLHEKWKRSGLQRLYLLSPSEIDLETLRAEGRSTGICPYELMRAGLGHRDIWIGDYNYLFSPASARLLQEQTDFDPSRTFLIIDEAHNLPSRVESAFSYEFAAHPLYAALDDLRAARAPARLQSLLKSLAQLLTDSAAPAYPERSDLMTRRRSATTGASTHSTRAAQQGFDATSEADFRHHLAQIAELLSSEPLAYEELQPETLELFFQFASAHAGQQRGELRHLLWSPAPGTARLECIDASQLIASHLSQYNAALFLSATLAPLDSYLDSIGFGDQLLLTPQTAAPKKESPTPDTQYRAKRHLSRSATKHPVPSEATLESLRDETPRTQNPASRTQNPAALYHLSPPAPWREQAYDVAIDLRVDTRLKSRKSHLALTAATIAHAAEQCGPAIVFFPSYAYAQQAYEAIQYHHPFIRAALQPRAGGSLADRAAYLEEALAFHDALLLILGSSYAEGVDTLGGKAGCAIVVSPALPEMNHIQEAKRQRFQAIGRNGFERAYLHPGIQKVNQALGRLVRAPGHRVKALLHCQRFAEPNTRKLLDPLYQSKTYLHNESDLDAWLKGGD